MNNSTPIYLAPYSAAGWIVARPARRRTLVGMVLLAALAGALLGGGIVQSPARAEAGWSLTTYYTALESMHPGGPAVEVHDCKTGASLGVHGMNFLAMTSTTRDPQYALSGQGSGKMDGPQTTDPAYRDKILGGFRNGDQSNGEYAGRCGDLLDQPMTASGRPAVAYKTAAGDVSRPAAPDGSTPAHVGVFAHFGMPVRITGCGNDSGSPVENLNLDEGSTANPSGKFHGTQTCQDLRRSDWVVDDIGPAVGGNHLDLYLGYENDADGHNFYGENADVDPAPEARGPSVAASSTGAQTVRVTGTGLPAGDPLFIEIDSRSNTWVSNVRTNANGQFDVTVVVSRDACGQEVVAYVYDDAHPDSDGRGSVYRAGTTVYCG
jgi:hypothetical protein